MMRNNKPPRKKPQPPPPSPSRSAMLTAAIAVRLPLMAEAVESGSVPPAVMAELTQFVVETMMINIENDLLTSFQEGPYRFVGVLADGQGKAQTTPVIAGAETLEKILEIRDSTIEGTIRWVAHDTHNLNWRLRVMVYNDTFDLMDQHSFDKSAFELLTSE